MSLQFIFGGSGYGKSTYVQNMLIKEAKENHDKNYLLIVPDQFTMQTQKQMVTRHEDGGIINIDVLSFSRLSYRIFSEVGSPAYTMLDDTGKCLLIRKVAGRLKSDLTVLGKGMNNPGWAENVKAALSEFMQYGIKEEDIAKLIENTSKDSLKKKLSDLLIIYKAFLEECESKYATRETILDVLCERVELSELIKNSVICFDGFTGFTPIQINVIERLILLADKVMITLTASESESVYCEPDRESLFYLTQKTVKTLQKRLEAHNIKLLDDVWLTSAHRYSGSKELAFLEKNLFRDTEAIYGQELEDIHLLECADIEKECHVVCGQIFNLIKEKGYRYRDIAVITGDMETYEKPLSRAFDSYKVAYHMDANHEVMSNPLIMLLRYTMQILSKGYKREDMINLLRTGLVGNIISDADIDRLENYCIARNISGHSKWASAFTKHTRLCPAPKNEGDYDPLTGLNESRQKCMAMFDCFYTSSRLMPRPAIEWLTQTYNFLDNLFIEKKLNDKADMFEESQDAVRASEYRQIYKEVMDLFDQIAGLMPDEVLTIKEFSDILGAGYKELRVGIIPQVIDQITVGDITRSRLGDVKALFLMGVNDGKVPKVSKKGGILSEMDKDYLQRIDENLELSPSARDQIFTENLYMYLNVTKPSEKLYISYSCKDGTGKAMFPAFFVKNMTDMFGKLVKTYHNEVIPFSVEDIKTQAGILLGKYVHAAISDADESRLFTMMGQLLDAGEVDFVRLAVERAFAKYNHVNISKEAADGIFKNSDGSYICSVSSLEEFSGCQFKHFLDYGLGLSEREIFGVESNDRGNIFHNVMQGVLQQLREEKKTLRSLSKEELDSYVEQIVVRETDQYNEGMLKDNAITKYYVNQVKRIAKFNLGVIKTQLSRGAYEPEYFEKRIDKEYSLDIDGESVKVKFTGRIDRTDIYVDEDNKRVYVKIIDYKTGNKKIESELVDNGAQLQLPLYLKVLSESYENNGGYEVVPVAGIYYRIKDEIGPEDNKDEQSHEDARVSDMCGNGIFNTEAFITLDERYGDKSSCKPKVIPVSGSVPRNLTADSLGFERGALDEYTQRIEDIALGKVREVLEGNIAVKPLCIDKKYDACEYCSFKSVCGFDEKISGYTKNEG